MKNSIKTAVLGLAALVSGFSACNDADYDTLGVHAFVSESASNKSTKVTITELGADAEITACLSEAATKDVKLKFVVDSEVLDRYNQKQASSFLVLPEEIYEMDSEVTIKAGEFSAPATKIHIKPLPKEYVGESYALPLRLVSADGSVPVTSVTSTYVITTEAIVVSSLPMFVGGAGLAADGFPLTLPQFTVEVRFQVSNTANRNRPYLPTAVRCCCASRTRRTTLRTIRPIRWCSSKATAGISIRRCRSRPTNGSIWR